MTATRTTTPIARVRAVKDIAAHLADQTAFVMMVNPQKLELLADRLPMIPDWTAYVDNGTDVILRTADARVLMVVDMLIENAVIVTIPKTVPATVIGEALAETIPADGAQDIVMVGYDPTQPMFWSLLFVDALQRVDPKTANAIRAASLSNLN